MGVKSRGLLYVSVEGGGRGGSRRGGDRLMEGRGHQRPSRKDLPYSSGAPVPGGVEGVVGGVGGVVQDERVPAPRPPAAIAAIIYTYIHIYIMLLIIIIMNYDIIINYYLLISTNNTHTHTHNNT